MSAFMPKISIIMSVYNEKIEHLRESILSILNQSFHDFEFIIINDNPSNTTFKDVILSYKDDRIKFYQNDVNFGLAMSMNKAAQISSTNCLVRMDADDIAENDRLLLQYKLFESGYDLIFSRYTYIDETSNPINTSQATAQVVYNANEISRKIIMKNIIHHPTVMMRKDIFNAVGGYRNFPCAQDYDLWLRMAEYGCKFYMIDQALLKYRINSNSVSSKKWYMQQLTALYIFKLSYERLKRGDDSFSVENYYKYLARNKYDDPQRSRYYKQKLLNLEKAYELKSAGRIFYGNYLWVKSILCSGLLRTHYVLLVKKYIRLKFEK